jgi:hypothetical protein
MWSVPALLLATGARADETTGNAVGLTGDLGSQVVAGGTNGSIAASTGFITPWADPGTTACVDVHGALSTARSKVGMWECNGGANQSWKLKPTGQIVGIDNECLDVPDSNTANGTQVQIFPCNGGANQSWDWKPDGTLRGIGGKCLSMPAGSNIYSNPDQGMVLEIDTCDGSANQQWMVHGVGEIRIGIGGDEFCVDVPSESAATWPYLNYNPCNGASSQKWTVTPSGLVVGIGGQCLSTFFSSTAPGTPLVISTCDYGVTQSWAYDSSALQPQPPGPISLVDGGACMDLYAGSESFLQLSACDGGVTQEWTYSQPLTVPLVPQKESDWCWLAVSEMTMEYLGSIAAPSQCEEANRRQANTSGWGPGGAQVDCCETESWNDKSGCDSTGSAHRVLVDWGYGVTCIPGGTQLSFSQLSAQVKAGLPVPFNVSWNSGGAHAMLAIDTEIDSWNIEWVVVNDPCGAGPNEGNPGEAKGLGDQAAMPYRVWSNTDNKSYSFTLGGQLTDVQYGGPVSCD